MTLSLQSVACEKGGFVLFSNITQTLTAGELLFVAGDNGSGKTTLLRILAGLNSSYEGCVYWSGSDIRTVWSLYAQSLLYLGHQPALKARLTARENLLWYAQCVGANANDVTAALLGMGLRGRVDLPVYQLSAGQQRRVVLARLLLPAHSLSTGHQQARPQKLWILDEPFTALDAQGFAAVFMALRMHLANGGMAVVTSHHGMEKIALPHRTLSLTEVNA